MIREDVVAEGWGSYVREVALARDRRGLLAVWSDASGTWAEPLDLEGRPAARARRVAPPVESLDLAATPDGFALALLARADLFAGGGGAELLRLDRRGAPRGLPVRLGQAGAYSKSIAVAHLGTATAVVWHDGTPGDPAVWLASPGGRARRLSSTQHNGCCPDLAASPTGGLVVWGEHEVDDEVSGRVLGQRLDPSGSPRGAAVVLARSQEAETWPILFAEGGRYGLGYRDLDDDDPRPQLFFAPFAGEWGRQGPRRRIGRYDGPTRGVVLAGGPHLAATEVRSWSREQIIALDRFEHDGERVGAQSHIFFDRVYFTDVDAVAVGTRYLLLYGEDQPHQRVWLGQIGCR